MAKKLIAVNVLLLMIAGLLGWQLRVSSTRFKIENDVSKIQPKRDIINIPVDRRLPAFQPPRRYNAAEFERIAAQNLFSDTRAREEKVEVPVVAETPPLDIKPVLVGITIAGEQRLALITDPSSQSQGRKTQTKRLGDTFRGYTIVDITDSQMVLQGGNRREVIPLFDTSKRPQGGKTPILATRVISFGAGAGGSATPAGAPGQTVIANIGSPARPAPAGQSPSQPGAAGVTRGQTQPPRTVTQAAPSSAPDRAWNERTDDQGRRVIRTPFGDIVRPEKPPNQ